MAARVLGIVLLVALGGALGFGLAWIGFYAWVWGALGIIAGLGCAWAALSYSFWQGLGRKWALILGCLGLCASFVSFEWREDYHQRLAFAQSYARMKAAGSGLDMATIEARFNDDTYVFLAKDADALLDQEVVRLGYQPDRLGRFFYRRDVGVRLGGPFMGGRGLTLGFWGGFGVWLAELGLGGFIVWRTCRLRPDLDPNLEQG